MSDNFATVDEPLPPAQALHVNDVCDRFEAAWKAITPGTPGPRIEDYLDGTLGTERNVLFRFLVLLEIDYRRLRGDKPTAAEYRTRFPDLPDLPDQFLTQGPPAPLNTRRQAAAKEGVDGESPVETTVYTPVVQPQVRSQRYVVQQFHARGGIGEVHVAHDVEIGRQVALKRLRKKREDQQERFLAEAQITGQLEHPGIVPVHDLGIDEEGQPFYIMSFIKGQPLKDTIEAYHADQAAPTEAREVQRLRLLEVFVKVCHAVAYAHHRGVIHRDLKPDNIILGQFGETLVLDWGLAKVLNQPEKPSSAQPVQPTFGSGSLATQDGSVLGSPAYMAPEMAEGHAANATERTDVYLLGATLYHLLTGRAPRQGSSREEVVELARSMPPTPPRRLKADVPRALEAICLKAMAHRPQDRYAGALELATDMERYLAGAPVSAYPEPLLVRAGRWCKRHRRGLTRALAAAVLLGLVLGGAALLSAAWGRADALSREADALSRQTNWTQRREQVRGDFQRFRRLADRRQFHGSPLSPVGESLTLAHDARRGQEAGQEAVQLAERLLGRMAELLEEMSELPGEMTDPTLGAERATLQEELHDLLLLMAHGEAQLPLGREAVPRILERLERAVVLKSASRTCHRLHARCYRALGQEARAAREERLAKDTPTVTALDYFLQAEEFRAQAGKLGASSGDALAWRPGAMLLRQAVANYQQALRLQPNHFWCRLQLGRCYLNLDKGAEALDELSTAVALRPDLPSGYAVRGLARGLVKRYAEGEADLEQALKIDPEFRRAQLNRGLLALLQRKDKQALDDFTRALEPPAERRLIEAAYYRGLLYMQLQKFPEALADLEAVVKDHPHFRPVYLNLAQLHFLRGDEPRCLADLARFLDLGQSTPLDPKGPRLSALRGRLLGQLVKKGWGLGRDDYAAALKLTLKELETARRLGARSPELLENLGAVELELGLWKESLADYQRALEQAPAGELAVKARTSRGWIYVLYHNPPRLDLARAEFAAAIRLDHKYADAHAGLGYIHVLEKAPSAAQREAALALFHEGDNYLILHNVACIYAELSQLDKGQANQHQDTAMDLLRRAVRLWRSNRGGINELEAIREDPALQVLKGRSDYQQLLAKQG